MAGLMLYQQPIFLLVALILIIIFNLLLDHGQQLKKWLNPIMTMSLFILISTPLFNRRGNHILFYFFKNQVMLEGVIQGIMIALSLTGILALFVTFNLVFTMDKFLFVFSKISHQWTLLIMLAMRFVPLLKRKIKDMENMQTVKGLSIHHGSLRHRAQSGMQLVQMLLSVSLEDSIQAADSMTARGYGTGKRSHYQAFKMSRNDYVILIAIILMGIILAYGWYTKMGVLELLPQLGVLWLGGWQNMFMVMWILFIGLPIILEGKEILKWRFYQFKTSASPIQRKSRKQ